MVDTVLDDPSAMSHWQNEIMLFLSSFGLTSYNHFHVLIVMFLTMWLQMLLVALLLRLVKKILSLRFVVILILVAIILYFLTLNLFFQTFVIYRVLYTPTVDNTWSIGGVSPNSAKVWVKNGPTDRLAHVQYWSDSKSVRRTESVALNAANQWSHVFALPDLQGATRYRYQIEFDPPEQSSPGEFATERFAVYPANSPPLFSGQFSTFPEVNDTENRILKFNVGSCIAQAPWKDMNVLGFWESQNIDLGMFIGDTVYVDLFGHIELEHAYGQIFNDPYFQNFTRNTPNYFMYDDHEIDNDYCNGTETELFNYSVGLWDAYLGRKNPGEHLYQDHARYFNLSYSNIGIFLLDIRTFRDSKYDKDSPAKSMLGAKQLVALFEWLENSSPYVFKFIVSPVPWTLRLNLQDGWTGYLYEREKILDFIESRNISGVVFISGDAHFSFSGRLSRDWAHEFSVGPLQQVPLFAKLYIHPTDHIVLHEGKEMGDRFEWIFDWEMFLFSYPFSFAHWEVNATSPDNAWADFSCYSYSIFTPVRTHTQQIGRAHV